MSNLCKSYDDKSGMNRRFFLVFLTASAASRGLGYAAESPDLSGKDFSQFRRISQGIRRALRFTLYEGLPHPMWEGDKLNTELATKKTVRRHDYPFYERPLVVAPSEVEPLRRLSAAGDSYSTYGGPKLCGAYHPDYCLEWSDSERVYEILVCFGCHEGKLYGPSSELLVDIRQEAFKAFEAALKKHRAQRP